MRGHWVLITILAAVVGLILVVDSALHSGATYDEVAYLRVAARWWRTGDQASITRMGSPLTFWKWQQAPTLWLLNRTGRGAWIDDPLAHQADLLSWVRLGALDVWLLAFGLTAFWARRLHGPRAMALAAWLFALSPNLVAHGSLVTMEMPLVACSAGVFFLASRFLETGRIRWGVAAAALTGLAFSCKFTAILFPPMLGLGWLLELGFWKSGGARTPLPPREGGRRPGEGDDRGGPFGETSSILPPPHPNPLPGGEGTRSEPVSEGEVAPQTGEGGDPLGRRTTRPLVPILLRVGLGMIAFLLIMALADGFVTGFATISPSERIGDHPTLDRLPGLLGSAARSLVESPLPQDWVAFATQMGHQRHGGPSYLLGERRMTGWWYYYLVALVVKVPLSFGLLVVARACQGRVAFSTSGDRLIALAIAAFLAITSAGSTRNYGIRYLLPLAPLALVWISGLAEGGRWARRAAILGLVGQAVAVAAIHPYELSYFNFLAGGPVGGRRILADSCLDWGQGTRSLARLQALRPEFRDLTLYQFGDAGADPAQFGVAGRVYVIDASDQHPGLPPAFAAGTRFVAVSASLQWGPWGPPNYFVALQGIKPVALTDDFTIAIYRASDVWAATALR